MTAPRKISYTPPVPDGPDCPWERGRRTRWWLVIPADLVSVVLVAALVGAALHDLSQIPEILVAMVASVMVAWLASYHLTKRHDHLESLGMSGWIVLGLTWCFQTMARLVSGGIDSVGEGVNYAFMTALMLLVTLAGWRWLYGFAKAQESVTPRAIRKRLEAQDSKISDAEA